MLGRPPFRFASDVPPGQGCGSHGVSGKRRGDEAIDDGLIDLGELLGDESNGVFGTGTVGTGTGTGTVGTGTGTGTGTVGTGTGTGTGGNGKSRTQELHEVLSDMMPDTLAASASSGSETIPPIGHAGGGGHGGGGGGHGGGGGGHGGGGGGGGGGGSGGRGGDPEAEIFPPDTLLEGKFQIQHRLGRGAMGTVYLAMDVNLKRAVAVKALGAQHRSRPLVERFRAEAESMAQVDHPNVVQIYSYGEHAGTPYFVMELLDGESLAEYIDRLKIYDEVVHLDEVIGILSQVCRGLSAIHARGIVHRDVKPANIMITSHYRVAVADFGLVGQISESAGGDMEVYGTPIYLAPERIDTRPVAEDQAHLCDVYALGVVLYEFLTGGEAPFDHEDTVALLAMHATEPPPRISARRPDLPPGLDDVLQKAMAKKPAERYQSAEAFRQGLLDARSSSAAGATGMDFTAVVVDSVPKSALNLVRAINKAFPGASVITVADGETGLAFIREARPDLLVLDADSPGLNALELCVTLQSENLMAAGARIVVVAPRASPLEIGYLRELGVSKVLNKSVTGAELIKSIRGEI